MNFITSFIKKIKLGLLKPNRVDYNYSNGKKIEIKPGETFLDAVLRDLYDIKSIGLEDSTHDKEK